MEWLKVGLDIDGEAAGDESGYSVSLSADGTRVAIGAANNDGNGSSDAGHVRIYELTNDDWVQMGSDINGEAGGNYSGYSVSLSADGTRVAIGAPANRSVAGHVRIYDYDFSSSDWVQMGSDIDGEAISDESGYSVSLSADGTRVAIGARGNGSSNAGHVRIYDFSSSAWVQMGSDIDGEAATDYSGWSVSLSEYGTRVAIGAIGNDGTGSDAGHVRIYELTNDDWVQMGSDIDGEAATDESGISVSLSADGTRVAIGATYNDPTINGNIANNAGHVRIYKFSNGAWSKMGDDIDGEAASNRSGVSVSLSPDGTRVAIGTPFNDGTTGTNTDNRGSVRVYEFVNTLPSPTHKTELSLEKNVNGVWQLKANTTPL